MCTMEYKSSNDLYVIPQIMQGTTPIFPVDTPNNFSVPFQLSVPFYYGPGVQPISLTSTEPAVGSIAVVSGWGQFSESDTTLPSQLQAVNVFILSRPECDYIFGSGVITENKFCTDVPGGGNGYCFGDQGGPLVADGQLVGIVHSGNGCAAFYHPGIYSNIATLKDFITEQTGVQ